MRSVSLALAVLVLLAAGSLRADVAPFPSWRLAANGTIMRAVQAGSAIYVAGTFTKIGRAVPAFSATLDPATLTFVPRTGCAQSGPSPLTTGYSFATTNLVDAAGPYIVPAGTAVVRIGSDCRFDRRFRVTAPPTGLFFPTGLLGSPSAFFELAGRVYMNATTAPGFPLSDANAARWIVEVDGITGALLRYWPVSNGSLFWVLGVSPNGQLIASTASSNALSTTIGRFDTTLGQFVPVYNAPGSWTLDHVGTAIVLSTSAGNDRDVLALDSATLTPLANWPAVRVGADAIWASDSSRLVVASSQLSIGGVAARRLGTFDAVTGAVMGAFIAPAWTDDPGTHINHLSVAGGRVIAIGDFAPGAPRDTAAAFDAVSGALDPWVMPFAVPGPLGNRGQLYFTAIDARDRVARRNIAAVDAATGDVLPFTAAVAPPIGLSRGYALAADTAAGHLYVGSSGAVRRFDLATGQEDPTWRLDTDHQASGITAVSDIALLGGTVYVSGGFSHARDNPASAWQSREGGAAITTAGSLTAWQPQVKGTCSIAIGPIGLTFPCVSRMLTVGSHLVMQGTITRLQVPGDPVRSAMSVSASTGADDGFLPVAPAGVVASIATDGSALFANAQLAGPTLVRVDDAFGARVVGPLGANMAGSTPSLAVHGGRVYADRERDLATAVATPNPTTWSAPVAASDGVLDVVASSAGVGAPGIDFYADIAGVAPRAPINLSATLDASTVRLHWSPGPGDLAPLVWPPAPGGTAATSHIVLASLTPGGPPAAQIDTASADTTFSIAAPTGTFYVRVQAKNAFGTSAPSAELRVDVQPQAPNSPLATIASVSGRTVHIEWQAPSLGWAATSYLLDAGTAPGLSNIGTLPVNGTTFDAPVPPGRYYVRVRAVNATGASVPSDEVIVDVP